MVKKSWSHNESVRPVCTYVLTLIHTTKDRHDPAADWKDSESRITNDCQLKLSVKQDTLKS